MLNVFTRKRNNPDFITDNIEPSIQSRPANASTSGQNSQSYYRRSLGGLDSTATSAADCMY